MQKKLVVLSTAAALLFAGCPPIPYGPPTQKPEGYEDRKGPLGGGCDCAAHVRRRPPRLPSLFPIFGDEHLDQMGPVGGSAMQQLPDPVELRKN